MGFTHLATSVQGAVTVVSISKSALAAIGSEEDFPNTPTMTELLQEFEQSIAAVPAGVVVDILETNFLNPPILSAVASLSRRLAQRSTPRAIACSREIKPFLRISKVDESCASFDNLKAAIEFTASMR